LLLNLLLTQWYLFERVLTNKTKELMETMFNHWDNLVAQVRNDMIFEHKNKRYGAYYLRIHHNRNMFIALLIGSSFFILLAFLPSIVKAIQGSEISDPELISRQITILPPPELPVEKIELPKEQIFEHKQERILKSVTYTEIKAEDQHTEQNIDIESLKTDTQIANNTNEGEGFKEIIIHNSNTGIVNNNTIEKPRTYVEIMPHFPGGDEKMVEFINNNVNYPDIEREMGISGTCYLTFVVEKDGAITDVKILRAVADGPGYSKAATDVVKKMPKWAPGKQNGKEVRVQFILPIAFKL
jgi:protein TonB